jgi:hypothetical protein
MAWQSILENADPRFALQHTIAILPAWLELTMNQATGDGGTCFGDSGGPHFLGGVISNLVVSITVTGDRFCKASDLTSRVDTASARAPPSTPPPRGASRHGGGKTPKLAPRSTKAA